MIRVVRDLPPGPRACKTCGASIVWAQTDNGRRMPVDTTACEGGNMILWYDQSGQRISSIRSWEKLHRRAYAGPRWLCHYVTCGRAPAPERSAPAPRTAAGLGQAEQLSLFTKGDRP